MTYVVLHPSLAIKKSRIHGMGIFARDRIPSDTMLGISHVKSVYENLFHCGYVRTPLGGLINHSEYPNCIKARVFPEGHWRVLEDGETSSMMGITTLRLIVPDEELTVFYTLWDIRQTFKKRRKGLGADNK